MNSFNIIPKAPQVRLKRGNNKGIRGTLCYAAVLLGIVALLIGCPDSAGDGNGDSNGDAVGTPTEETKVQSAPVSAVTTDAITLNWTAPTDIDGFLGVTITITNSANMLLDTVELDDSATEYQVTGLVSGTTYTFTITTRYIASGKNNDTMITAMTAAATGVQSVMLNDDSITSDSVTIEWDDPEDMDGYTGITISIAATAGDFAVDTPRMVDANTNTLTISDLDPATPYTLTLTFATQYDTAGKGSSSERTIPVMTQSNLVTAVTATDITVDSITLSWIDPEDTTGYSGVMVSGSTTTGDMITPQTISATAGSTDEEVTIADLMELTTYTFTLTTQYDDGKAGGDTTPFTATTRNSIDVDGDTLVDINSLERLDNVRYNLDLGATGDDGRYKESTQTAENAGTLCGNNADEPCTGYELTRSLDFNDDGSYESGIANKTWRPNAATDSTGMVLMQSNADNGINAGWDPIGSCNTDGSAGAGTDSCGDNNDTPFAARFEGNGYTISNLYARNTTTNNGSATGLFGITAATATIRSLGVQDVALYGGRASDRVGGMVGDNGGTIVGSYASGGSVTGSSTDANNIGGLVGNSSGTIVASYTAVAMSTTSNVQNNNVGGLLGRSDSGSTVIASYTSSTVDGSSNIGNEPVGGLIGSYNAGSVIAAYASDAVDGGDGGSADFVGGLTGSGLGTITASYASGSVNGGHASSLAGALRGNGGMLQTNFSYGFGTVTNDGGGGYDGTAKPTVDGTAITMARQLTLANAGTIWNSAANDTLNAWHFGDSSQAPALRYADYDGAGTDYHCGNNDELTGIPTVVAAPGGPLDVQCGMTFLPGQGR